jgi:hypothetical protein
VSSTVVQCGSVHENCLKHLWWLTLSLEVEVCGSLRPHKWDSDLINGLTKP